MEEAFHCNQCEYRCTVYDHQRPKRQWKHFIHERYYHTYFYLQFSPFQKQSYVYYTEFYYEILASKFFRFAVNYIQSAEQEEASVSDIDKMYDLLARLYNEVKEDRKETNQSFEHVNQRLDSLEAGQKKLETTLEHDIMKKLQAVHERAGDNTDKLRDHTERLESIERKIDILAMSINAQDK